MNTPYGHTAYTRTSKHGKVTRVNAKGVRRRVQLTVPQDKPTRVKTRDGYMQILGRKGTGEGRHVSLTRDMLDFVIKDTRFALVSAGPNPNFPSDEHLTKEQIQQRHVQLGERLKQAGFAYTHVVGHYGGREDTYLVMMHDADPVIAKQLGEDFNQDSVVIGDHGKFAMHYTTGAHRGERHVGTDVEVGTQAKDFYTIVRHPGGVRTKFAIDLDMGTYVKSMWSHVIMIDLRKGRGRKAGSQNKTHAYIARFLDPVSGKWRRIYPEDTDGVYLPSGQFQLAEGVTIQDIVNRALFGERLSDDPDTGKPRFSAGLFARHVATLTTQYEHARKDAHKHGFPDPYAANAMERSVDGVWSIFTYPKRPAVEWADVQRKQPTRWAGYAGLEMGHGIDPSEVSIPDAFHAPEQAHKDTAVASQYLPAGPAGKTPITAMHPTNAETGLVIPLHDHGQNPAAKIGASHPLPAWDSETTPTEVTGGDLTGMKDPIKMAQAMLKRLAIKDDEPLPAVMSRIGAFDAMALAKYASPQEFRDELVLRPVTTMMTLGLVKPSGSTPNLNKMLVEEWTSRIRRMAGIYGAGAHKESVTYAEAVAADEAAGTHHQSKLSAARQIELAKTNELAQLGYQKLLEVAHEKYGANVPDPEDRFDKYAAYSIYAEIKQQTMTDLKGKTVNPLLHEGQMHEAARIAASRADPLAPDEHAELRRVTPTARAVLHNVLTDMPETYRRILNARLWLTDGEVLDAEDPTQAGATSAAYTAHLDQRAAAQEQEMEAKRLAYAVPDMQRDQAGWRRNYVGAGGIAEMYPKWKDPETGKTVNLASLGEHQQRRNLKKWFEGAVKHLFGQLATMSPSGKMTLSSEGMAVRRFLELESKLANANRRAWSDAPVPTTQLPAPGGLITPLKREMYADTPAAAYFLGGGTKVQELAERLGMGDFRTLMSDGHVAHMTPSTRQSQLLGLAQEHHAQIAALQALPTSALPAARTAAVEASQRAHPSHVETLRQRLNTHLGTWSPTASTDLNAQIDALKPHSPEAASFLSSALASGISITGGEGTQKLTQLAEASHRRALKRVAIVDHVATLKSFRKLAPVETLAKAFWDYDFELGRLFVEIAA